MDSTGLYYYGARYYDPEIGRFISPDSIIPHSNNPQSFNRYSYCLNNPLRYIDPTGHEEDDYNPNPDAAPPGTYPPGFDSNGHAIPGFPSHGTGNPYIDALIEAIYSNRPSGIKNIGISRVTILSKDHLKKYGPLINQLDEVTLWFVETDSTPDCFLQWRNAGAMAINEKDVIISESLAKDETRLIDTIPEELYHCWQAKNGGGGFFQFFRYEYYDLTVGYRDNPYERQAKAFAETISKTDPWSYKNELRYLIRK